MILVRAITIVLLLSVGSFAAASNAQACASTAMSVSRHSLAEHDVATTSGAGHWQSVDSSTRHCPSHGGSCADVNCGFCYNVAAVASPIIVLPVLSLDEQLRASSMTSLLGRDVAPETGPPKPKA